MKVLLVGSQHGDERLGDRLIRRIKLYHPSLLATVDFYLANPKAYRLNKRFIDSDMNRSYGSEGRGYESSRTSKLLGKIKIGGYDLVLDLHTTTDKMEACFITSPTSSKPVNDFLKASSISKVIVMKHAVVNSSLIGSIANAVSIEASVHLIDKEFLEELITAIKRFSLSKFSSGVKKEFFYVDLKIEKAKYTTAQFGKMRNFELFENRFYPVLIQSNSYKKYKTYRGFGATVKTIKLIE